MLIKSKDENVAKELMRKSETGEDESIFIKNLENVQGDERDIIIFSITYGHDEDDKFRQAFGPINTKGGENRINVAVSRAKTKIYIIKSIKADEINVVNASVGKKIFHDYLEFVEYFDQSKDLNSEQINLLFKRYLGNSESLNKKSLEARNISAFEKDVYDRLMAKINTDKFEIVSDLEQSGYKIDFAIRNKATGHFVLAIECDGYKFHFSEKKQKECDFYRQHYLEERG
jgi:hypothetical protein